MLAAFAVLAAGGFVQRAPAVRWQPVSALGDIFNGGGDNASRQILLDIRLPRAIVAALVGMNLAVSGAVLQAVMKNPLADPHIIGISSRRGAGGHFCYGPVSGVGIFNCTNCVLRRHTCRSLHL